jgi:hypothetical protein
MRPVLGGLAAAALAFQALPALAQQGSVHIHGAAQAVTGSPDRTGGAEPLAPDFGVSWLQPGERFGTFQLEARGTRRSDRFHLGRTYASLRDLKAGGLSWTFEAGDAYMSRPIVEYRFTNMIPPAVTLSGGIASGRSARGSIQIAGGRATAWRSIFGNDPDTLAQWIGALNGSYRLTDRLELLGRASRIRTSGLEEFAFSIADSRQAGGGLRFVLSPSIELIGDGSFVQYRRRDSGVQERDGSFLAGANVHLPRGWLQINASRLSPGEFPVMNDPLHDRQGVFVAGDYDVSSRARVFGGGEVLRTNLNPSEQGAADLPRNSGSRAFGGIRVVVGSSSSVAVRVEEGAALSRPTRGGLDFESDTGVVSAEWQTALGPFTTYTRAARRENVTRPRVEGSYTQHELGTQLFVRLSSRAQLFGLGSLTRHRTEAGEGTTYWQIGGGTQLQLQPDLWFRGEATTSRNVDLLTRDFVPREAFDIGINGRLGRGMSFALSVAADRTPLLFGSGSPWTTRSLLRVTQSFSTGAARAAATSITGPALTRARGTATVLGTVFTDWNANGVREPDEEPLENIPVRIAGVSAVTTRLDGEFSFLNIPAGPQEVALDTSAIPVDFDPPAESSISVELDRGVTRRVSFGLIPLGSVRGRVIHDDNGNGRADPGEPPVDGAVLVLDGGERSEQVRRGVYRFDAIRSGDHVVSLLRESLPEGAVITGATAVPLALQRGQLTAVIDFTVSIEKRPELRRVFPPRGGATPRPSPGAASRRPGPAAPSTRAVAPPVTRPATSPRPAVSPGSIFSVQVAALLDPLRARALARQLGSAGYPSYLLAPPPDDPQGPYRVRIGPYRSRAAAAAGVAKLQRQQAERLWVIPETAAVIKSAEKPGTQ